MYMRKDTQLRRVGRPIQHKRLKGKGGFDVFLTRYAQGTKAQCLGSRVILHTSPKAEAFGYDWESRTHP